MVKIGSKYSPFWFRKRDSNGAYSALRAPMGQDEVRLQKALLRKNATREARSKAAFSYALYIVTTCVALGVFLATALRGAS